MANVKSHDCIVFCWPSGNVWCELVALSLSCRTSKSKSQSKLVRVVSFLRPSSFRLAACHNQLSLFCLAVCKKGYPENKFQWYWQKMNFIRFQISRKYICSVFLSKYSGNTHHVNMRGQLLHPYLHWSKTDIFNGPSKPDFSSNSLVLIYCHIILFLLTENPPSPPPLYVVLLTRHNCQNTG